MNWLDYIAIALVAIALLKVVYVIGKFSGTDEEDVMKTVCYKVIATKPDYTVMYLNFDSIEDAEVAFAKPWSDYSRVSLVHIYKDFMGGFNQRELRLKNVEKPDIIFKTVEDVHKYFNPISPNHYETKTMRCRDITKIMVEGLTPQEAVHMANIVKYIYRFKSKDGMKDLKKAAEYLTFLMEDTEIKGE